MSKQSNTIKLSALNAGKGDAFLLEDEKGEYSLIDTGVKGTLENSQNKLPALERIIITHNDNDHTGGIVSADWSKLEVKEIWLPIFFLIIEKYVCEHSAEFIDSEIVPKFIKFMNDNKGKILIEDVLEENGFVEEKKYDLIDALNGINNGDCLSINIQNGEHHFNCDSLVISKDLGKKSSDINLLYSSSRVEKSDNVISISVNVSGNSNFQRLFQFAKNLKAIKADNILKIIEKSKENDISVRYFRPSAKTVSTVHGTNFAMLNAKEVSKDDYKLKDDSLETFFACLYLSQENKNSLVFEYHYDGRPIILFTADSDLSMVSTRNYTEPTVVTAPHHGSDSNADAYRKIAGNDIIYLRSGKPSKLTKTGCFEKNAKNKICNNCCMQQKWKNTLYIPTIITYQLGKGWNLKKSEFSCKIRCPYLGKITKDF